MQDAKAELYALWSRLFGEPPSIEASSTLLTCVLVRALPAAPPYHLGAPVYPPPDEG